MPATAKFEIKPTSAARSFSVTNYGAVGGIFGTPMVNFAGIRDPRSRPGADGSRWCTSDQIVPRLILPLSLSFDHRIVDGADGGPLH